MKSLTTDKGELINICKNEYRNQPDELKIIHDFEKNYSSDQALWWYTRESCFSRLLTKALYTKNLTLLSLFGFFIRDIQHHLKRNQSQSSIRVYYGQIMSSDELIRLKNSIGHYLLIDRFLSTDLTRAQTSQSLNNFPVANDFFRILFEIEAAPQNDSERSFADITAFTYPGQKQQALFMSGSMFHLTAVQQQDKKTRLWVAKLVLTNMDKDYDDSNLTRCGQIILDQIGQIDTAEAYFSRLVKEAPETVSVDLSNCFHALGFVYFEKHNFDLSLNWYYKAIQTSTWNSLDSADSYYSMGCTYQKTMNNQRALECYQAALAIWPQLRHDDPTVEMANCWNNMGCIYEIGEFYHKALECHTNALAIRERLDVDIGLSRNNIGNIYFCLGEYATALEHYQFAFEKKKKTMPFRHLSIGKTLANIGLVYEYDGNWKTASEYYSKAASIFRELFPTVHIYNVQIQEDLQRVVSTAKFESVDTNLETAV
jgi:tetratricopeptide (TPR) repeat protein